MSAADTKHTSETNWERIDRMSDEEIDTSDTPPLTDAFFKRAKLRTPRQAVAITVKVDPDVLAWFKAQGEDYERRMSAALRIYAEAHQS